MEIDEECSICLESLKSFKICKLECDHYFHEDCIKEWNTKSDICPLCNQPMKFVLKKKKRKCYMCIIC